MAAALANKGSVMGVEVLSEAAWEQLHRDPVPANIFNIFPTNFSQVSHAVDNTVSCIVPQIDPSAPQPVVQSRPLLGPSPC